MSNRHYFAEEALSVELSNDELRWSSFVPSLDRRFSRRSGRVIGGGPRSVSSRTWLCCSKKMVISTLTLLRSEERRVGKECRVGWWWYVGREKSVSGER